MEKQFNSSKGRKRRYLVYLIPTFFVILIFILARFVIFIGYVPSASMEPTIKKDSLIVGMRILGDIEVGNVVVFKKDGQYLVKRVVAVGGSTVSVDDKKYTVPCGAVFLLGDNKNNSYDSRFWEEPFVSVENIVAKIFI